jgi:carboxymethylenebutenolidase
LGLAVDLALVERSSGRELAMGTPYDTFSAATHTASALEESMRIRSTLSLFAAIVTLGIAAACARNTSSAAGDHAHPAAMTVSATSSTSSAQGATQGTALPAGATDVVQRLARSPRHAEWVMVRTAPDSVRAWVVFPERRERAPVVVVIHEVFGLTAWVRGVADQLAADGFIAIAPDLLTGKTKIHPDSAGSDARDVIRTLNPDDVHRQLAAIGQYGMQLPAALPRYGVVGFCWGGSASFQHAVRSPSGLGAAVVYYGSSPENLTSLASIRVPVLGLYGGDDARVNRTVPPADSTMRALGKTFQHHTYEGAGHGFLRQQDGREGANMAATRQAWPATIAFFRRHLGP